MKRTRTTNAAIAATLLCFAPQVARADAAADARLAKLEARIGQLEDKLAKSEQTIAEQQVLLSSQATPAVSAGSEPSSLDAFLNTVSIGGYASASYLYNNNNPDNPSYAQAVNQFNLNHNTFNIDGAKLELGRVAAESGQAGFQIDLMFGDDGGILGGYGPNAIGDPDAGRTFGNASDNFVYLQEAWASYNWNDTTFKFGKFETLLGYEVIDAPYNRNVTHGILFTYAIPLVHTGLLVGGPIAEGFGWQAGVVNGWNNATDSNDNKGVLGQLSFSQGSFSTGLNAYYGSDGYTGFADIAGSSVDSLNHSRALVLDWTATVTATDAITVWWNVDWGQQDDVVFGSGPNTGDTDDATWYGAALGTQFAFNDKTSLAVRGEWFRDSDGYRMFIGEDSTAYSLTGTLGYKLTDNLVTRVELRWDDFKTDNSSDDVFPQGGGVSDSDLYGLLHVAYVFD